MDYTALLLQAFKDHKWINFFNIIDMFTNKILQNKNIYYPLREDIIQEMRYYAVTLTRKYLSSSTGINKYKEYLTIAMKHEILDMIHRSNYHFFIPKRGSKYYKNQSYEQLLEYVYSRAEYNCTQIEKTCAEEYCQLLDFIDLLKHPENDVTKLYYGISNSRSYTLEEIAQIMNFSHKATVYNILKRALKNLKEILLTHDFEY